MKKKRQMHGLPLIDALEPTTIVLDPPNFLEGVPVNGDECAIAKACQIQFRSPFVHVTRTMAYVAFPNERSGVQIPGTQGKWVMVRFMLDTAAKRAVEEVDTRRSIPRNTKITLRPIPPPQRLGARTKRRGRGGSHAPNRGLRPPNLLDLQGVRNYTGKIPH